MNGQNRADIKIGGKVRIVLKADQPTGGAGAWIRFSHECVVYPLTQYRGIPGAGSSETGSDSARWN